MQEVRSERRTVGVKGMEAGAKQRRGYRSRAVKQHCVGGGGSRQARTGRSRVGPDKTDRRTAVCGSRTRIRRLLERSPVVGASSFPGSGFRRAPQILYAYKRVTFPLSTSKFGNSGIFRGLAVAPETV